MEMLVSGVDGIELTHPEGFPLLGKFVQVLGVTEPSGLWAWGALLLALAATLASILTTRKLACLFPQSIDTADISEPCRCSGDASTSSSTASFSAHVQSENNKEPKADRPMAVPGRPRAPDSAAKTKGKVWLKEEDQLEGLDAESWDLSNGAVVKSWSQGLFPGHGSRTIIGNRFRNEHPMPVVAMTRTGDAAVWDPRFSFLLPVILSHQHRRPVPDIAFEGADPILFSYDGSCNDLSIPDVRMLSSNFNAGIMSGTNFSSLVWEDDATIAPDEKDELPHSGFVEPLNYTGWNKSPKRVNSRSMVFWFLNSVRSVSSGLKDLP